MVHFLFFTYLFYKQLPEKMEVNHFHSNKAFFITESTIQVLMSEGWGKHSIDTLPMQGIQRKMAVMSWYWILITAVGFDTVCPITGSFRIYVHQSEMKPIEIQLFCLEFPYDTFIYFVIMFIGQYYFIASVDVVAPSKKSHTKLSFL